MADNGNDGCRMYQAIGARFDLNRRHAYNPSPKRFVLCELYSLGTECLYELTYPMAGSEVYIIDPGECINTYHLMFLIQLESAIIQLSNDTSCDKMC
jgi:hypothetical protein